MSVKKINGIYWYEFRHNKVRVRKSTKQGDKKVAEQMEAAHLSALAKGSYGIGEKQYPKLADFLVKDFLPFVDTKHANKPATIRSYRAGVRLLTEGKGSHIFSELRLHEVSDEHGVKFTAANEHLSPSTINCGLRTLRRALKLAIRWGRLDAYKVISLAAGERNRDRVLSREEQEKYLAVAAPDLHLIAIIILGTGMRPGEVFCLRWENVDLAGDSVIDIKTGKTKNAKRQLPMVARVYDALQTYWDASDKPKTGWVFPTHAACGHITTIKTAHATAIERSGVKKFCPYTMRHTALTELGAAGVNAFTIQKIAGHASVVTTQKYVHPGDAAVRAAFDLKDGQENGHTPQKRIKVVYAKPA